MANGEDPSLEDVVLNALNFYKQKGEMPTDFAPTIIRYFAHMATQAGLDRDQSLDSAMLIASALMDAALSFGRKSKPNPKLKVKLLPICLLRAGKVNPNHIFLSQIPALPAGLSLSEFLFFTPPPSAEFSFIAFIILYLKIKNCDKALQAL